ncbi:hypothetical protein D9757_008155 [Collybiopsis confluens]|uniref:DUF202 domain-containing protein n=1 Tax=Collybiopsis confluens TaxID=2823264 RepID=A0A8H5HDY8_9AGAR|nr:hypothetical protein D9757_008155 [Collybiopsis confluens]
MSHSYRYRGHRAQSFSASDINELVELRARQRTFYGAYFRTALGNLGYSLTILRLFDSRFYKSKRSIPFIQSIGITLFLSVGLLFLILGALLFVISFLRDRHSRHDFADLPTPNHEYDTADVIQTVGQKGSRIFGRPFVTAGWIVIAVAGVVLAVEIGLLVTKLKKSPLSSSPGPQPLSLPSCFEFELGVRRLSQFQPRNVSYVLSPSGLRSTADLFSLPSRFSPHPAFLLPYPSPSRPAPLSPSDVPLVLCIGGTDVWGEGEREGESCTGTKTWVG